MDDQHQAHASEQTPTTRRKTRWIMATLAMLAIAVVCILAGLRAYLPRFVRDTIVSQFSRAPGVETQFDDIRFRLWAGQIEAGRLAVASADSGAKQGAIGWQGLDIFLEPLSLLGSLARVSSVMLDAPVCHLVHEADESTNLQKLFPKSKDRAQGNGEPPDRGVVVGQIALRKGLFTFTDHTVGPTALTLAVRDIDACGKTHYNIFGQGATFCSFRANAELFTNQPGRCEIAGSFEQGRHLHVDCYFSLKDIGLKHIDPYCRESAVQLVGGSADVQGHFQRRDDHLECQFDVRLRGAKVSARKGIVNELVLGVPTRAALILLSGEAGELPVHVEISGSVNDPQFRFKRSIIAAIGEAFAGRFKQLGHLGVTAVALSMKAGKKVVEATVDVGEEIGKTATRAAKDIGRAADKLAKPAVNVTKGAVDRAVGVGESVGKTATKALKDIGETATDKAVAPVGKALKETAGKIEKGIGRLVPFGKKKEGKEGEKKRE